MMKTKLDKRLVTARKSVPPRIRIKPSRLSGYAKAPASKVGNDPAILALTPSLLSRGAHEPPQERQNLRLVLPTAREFTHSSQRTWWQRAQMRVAGEAK